MTLFEEEWSKMTLEQRKEAGEAISEMMGMPPKNKHGI